MRDTRKAVKWDDGSDVLLDELMAVKTVAMMVSLMVGEMA